MLNEKVKEEENEEKLTGTTGLLWCLLRAQLESTLLFTILKPTMKYAATLYNKVKAYSDTHCYAISWMSVTTYLFFVTNFFLLLRVVLVLFI